MKKLAIIILCAAMFGCGGPSPSQITSAVALGTSTALNLISDTSKRTQIADYIDVGAAAVRSIPDTGTEAELTEAITKAIPDNVKAEFPQLLPHILPVAITVWKITHNASAIAAGLEQGASCCITRK